MDIRNFFSKKGGKENGGSSGVAAAASTSADKSTKGMEEVKKKKNVIPPTTVTKRNSTTKSPQQHQPLHETKKTTPSKRKIHDNHDDDDLDDIQIIPNPNEECQRTKNSRTSESPKQKETTNNGKTAKTTTSLMPPKTKDQKEEHDIFLDDTSDDEDNNNDNDDYEASFTRTAQRSSKVKQPSPNKKKKVSTTVATETAETVATRRTSPRKVAPQLNRQVEDVQIPVPSTSETKLKQKSTQTQQQQRGSTPIIQPEAIVPQSTFDMNCVSTQCLMGITFCLSGIMEDLSRDTATEMIKVLGGRVTTAVSSKTQYLILGSILEDGRPVEQGSKYIRAASSPTILIYGKESFYGLLQQYSDRQKTQPINPKNDSSKTVDAVVVRSMSNGESNKISAQPMNTTADTAPPVLKKINPYASSSATSTAPKPTNPYAQRPSSSNPYMKNTASIPPSTNTVQSRPQTKNSTDLVNGDDRKLPGRTKSNTIYDDTIKQLWVDKYKPKHSSEILGNQDAVRKLSVWLSSWEDTFNTSRNNKIKPFSAPNGPWKAALLSGPPGIGKTTTATLVANESGRDVLEFNASDVRSKKAMQEEMGDITGSHTLEFRSMNSSNRFGQKQRHQQRTKRCIVMDEVDGMGAGDRSGMSELIQMIKTSRVPIICICNDRQSQKIKSLLPYCMDLRYRRPTKSVIANRAVHVAKLEGLVVEPNAAEAIVESCGNDVRQVLNCLQMWSSSSSNTSMTYKDLKERENSINKDEILRVSLFDAVRVIVEGRKGLAGADIVTQRNHFFHRNDAYYVDYNFTGLLVQQNYLKVMQPQFNDLKRQNNNMEIGTMLDRMYNASLSMSDWAIMDGSLHMDMNWSLLPSTAAMAVKTGYHAGGENGCMLGGFPEFSTWLGRNSTRNKKIRIMNELCHHMNYKISASTTEMRISYLPLLRTTFLTLLSGDSQDSIQEAIELMDEYGLDRDDIFEKLDEFTIESSGKDSSKHSFQKIDSKKKANFTRLYNLGSHRSQALVAEQGAIKKSKRAATSGLNSLDDPDAINDDEDDNMIENDDEDNDDDEQDIEKIRAAFQKKGSRAASKKAATAANSKKPAASRKKK